VISCAPVTTSVLESLELRVNVAEIMRRPGESKRLVVDGHAPGLVLELGHVTDEGAVRAELLLEVIVEGIYVSGVVQGVWAFECRRCLAEFTEPFNVEVAELYAYEQPEDDEGYQIEAGLIDLVPMIRDAVLLAAPVNPLHDPDCKGLCSVCGQDLNVADCGHRAERVNLAWEPLKRLREQMGE
jgi:DUF177 domain-containing protein